jgi:hypothetical protein
MTARRLSAVVSSGLVPFLLAALCALGLAASSAWAETTTVTPEADTYVSSASPNKNYGGLSDLFVEGDPVRRAYLRFTVPLPQGAVVKSAALRLYTRTAQSSRGVYLNDVPRDDWSEMAATYGTAPAMGARLGASGGWSSPGWRTVPVLPEAVKPGKNSVGLTTPSGYPKAFAARESSQAPQLVVEYSTPTESPPQAAVDVALGKESRASSTEQSGLDPAKANDGDSSTRWSSAFADDQWWQVDLGRYYSIDRVGLNWEGAYASRYQIETSEDGNNFSDAANVEVAKPGPEVTSFAPRRARHVRVRGLERATPWGISLWDAQVFGDPTDPPPAPACSDGRDNDGDSKTDHPADPGCSDTSDNDESDPPPAPKDPVIGAAGDIASSNFNARNTASLLDDVDQVLTLGDNAYPDGTLQQFRDYYEPTWGRHKAKTRPSPGNHEYHSGGSGYYDYFGALAGERGKGYYSFDLGGWHVVSLNSASMSQTQIDWLKQDLAANPDQCTLAYWHHPRWNTGSKGNNSSVAPLWNALYDAGADVVLSGHDHNYQRHAPRDKGGAVDQSYGIRQFTAGTGGVGLYDINPSDTETFNDSTHGVIKLTLRGDSYDWRFVPVAGKTYTDSGTGRCHGKPGSAPPPPPPPSTSGNLAPASGALFGAWHKPSASSSWTTGEYDRWEAAVGRKMKIDHRFVSWGSTYWPGSNERWDNENGRHPMISIGGSNEFPGLDAVNNGSQDAWITGRADAIKALGFKVLLRPLWEMNGRWDMPWQGSYNHSSGTTDGPAKYVAAWKRIVNIFRQRGVDNALWVWAPNCDSEPNDAWNNFTNYYPGDSYVDWVGCDGYNFGTTGLSSTAWSDAFGNSWDGKPSVYATYPHKPFMAAETSSCEGGDKGAWITQARSDIKERFPNLKAFVWFDENKECDWRAESSPGALSAFRGMAGDAYFNP